MKLSFEAYRVYSLIQSSCKGHQTSFFQRIEKIAYGSGTSVKEVKELINYLNSLNQVGRMLNGQDPEKLLRMLRGGRIPRGRFPF